MSATLPIPTRDLGGGGGHTIALGLRDRKGVLRGEIPEHQIQDLLGKLDAEGLDTDRLT